MRGAGCGVRNIVGLEKVTIISLDVDSISHASDFLFGTSYDRLSKRAIFTL